MSRGFFYVIYFRVRSTLCNFQKEHPPDLVMIRTILSLLLLMTAATLPAQTRSTINRPGAQSSKLPGNTYALIIGISDYTNITDLRFADRDAKAFERFLLKGSAGNIAPTNVFTFVNQQATKINITDALSTICRKLKRGDRLLFFFAGHGDMEVRAQKENGLLLLHNSPAGGYFGIIDDVIEINQLRNYLTPVADRGAEVVYIIDACHSGKLSGGKEGAQQTAAALLATWGNEHKILSCQPNQFSLESPSWGGGRGLFSLKLEEALTGAADQNKDSVISMLELYLYTAGHVSRESKYQQVPLISGDLTSKFLTIRKTRVKEEVPPPNPDGAIDSAECTSKLSAEGRILYDRFDSLIKSGAIIYPWDESAAKTYLTFRNEIGNGPALTLMKRRLVSALSNRFQEIVTPLLSGNKSYSDKDACAYAALELRVCMELLGDDHYLYGNIRARKLYMDAMALTWALADNEYNIGMKPTVDRAIDSLELSYQLEPNAAYTSMALGERYAMTGDLVAAEKYFNEYLSLRPNNLYAQYAMAELYSKLEQHQKAEKLYRQLVDSLPSASFIIWKAANMMVAQGRGTEALLYLERIAAIPDSGNYFFYKAVTYGNMDMTDSALLCYRQLERMQVDQELVDNNAGHMFFVSRRVDSAYHRWTAVLKRNPRSPFPNFNVGSVEVLLGNYQKAIPYFQKCIDNAIDNPENIVIHSELYMGKQYKNTNNEAFRRFSKRVYTYRIRYYGYLNILYCHMRDETLRKDTEKITWLFEQMRAFKEFEMFTHFHYACWRAINGDVEGTLDSVEKALRTGFGSHYQLTNDLDLSLVWDHPRFKTLMARYFTSEGK